MKVSRITDNLIQLKRMHFVNAYLVAERDGFTLVDTTMGKSAADELIAAAREAGAEIRRIALTHGHGDHIGALDGLRAALGANVEVLLGTSDARFLAGEQLPEGKLRGSWPKISTRPDTLLSGGERVGSLEVVASPGHTPGHVAFLDTRDRTLIAGDTYTSYGRTEIPNHFAQRFPLATMGTQDRRQVVESARALRALDPAILVCGHGPAVSAPAVAMDAAIARAGGN
jgi:glyoxylase-like metal-dependent hydrolase (beta-lactamase superfamily II)